VSNLVVVAVRLSGKEVLVRQGPIRRDCRFFDLELASRERLGRAGSKYNSSLPVFGLQEFVALNNFMSGTRRRADGLGLDWPEACRILRKVVKEFGSGKGATAEQGWDTEGSAVQGKGRAGKPMGLADLPPKRWDHSSSFADARLTELQIQSASLRWEYGLSVTEISDRIGRHRKTVYLHLSRASLKMGQAGVKEKISKRMAQVKPGELG
jgi:DNA-binding CsgD family transcriptional regulator